LPVSVIPEADMDHILFADDVAITPISELKQAAKALAREGGLQLSTALDRVAGEKGFRTWGDLMAKAWTLLPIGAPENDGKDFHLIRGSSAEGKMAIFFQGKDGIGSGEIARHATLTLARDGGSTHHVITFQSYDRLGRNLVLSEEALSAMAPEASLQSQARAFIRAAVEKLDEIPLMHARISWDPATREASQGGAAFDLQPVRDSLLLAVEIPGGRERFEVDVPLPMSAEVFRASFRQDDAADIFRFRLQKDGSLLLRRAHVKDEETAKARLSSAAGTLCFMAWTGLAYGSETRRIQSSSDSWMMESRHDPHLNREGRDPTWGDHLYDHHHAMVHLETGLTVVVNHPYDGHSRSGFAGLDNALSCRTQTIKLPSFVGLHNAGTQTLLHAFRDAEIDLPAIGRAALSGAVHCRDAQMRKVGATTPHKRPKTRNSAETRDPASPIGHVVVDFDQFSLADKVVVFHELPDEKSLRGRGAKAKMKAFAGKDLLSWDIIDREQSYEVPLTEVLSAIRKCPLDADLWSFLDLFKLSANAKLEIFKRGVVAGEVLLGRDLEREVGHFWGLLHTRPYMRALNMLYRHLVKMGRPADALPIGRRMLELCPNDNIGIRFSIDAVEAAISDEELRENLVDAFEKEEWD
jgi:hypothetical protein